MIEDAERIRLLVNATMALTTSGAAASNVLGHSLRGDNTKVPDAVLQQMVSRVGHTLRAAEVLANLLGVSTEQAIQAANAEIASAVKPS